MSLKLIQGLNNQNPQNEIHTNSLNALEEVDLLETANNPLPLQSVQPLNDGQINELWLQLVECLLMMVKC